ncbi:Uncharacterised protein [Bordetella pertussis]|nr:Uncharacterised protein [Bordetella pertussis]
MAAVVAEDEPQIVEKNMVVSTAAPPRPPLTQPISARPRSISRPAMPPVCIRRPASTKNGTAISANESIDSNMVWGTASNGTSRASSAGSGAMPRLRATGMLAANSSNSRTTAESMITPGLLAGWRGGCRCLAAGIRRSASRC